MSAFATEHSVSCGEAAAAQPESVAAAAPDGLMRAQGGTAAAVPVRVLYVDDDPGLCRLVQRQFGRLGYEVTTATSGAEGLQRLAAGTFDVVALDHYMPGHSTLTAMHDLPDAPPVVYVTGTQESSVAVAALKAGAVDYVVKDIHTDFVELLRAAFDTAVTQVRMRRAHAAAQEEIRAARDRFEALAAERALLLREMNHRVGNSLQIIVSLLSVQAGATDSAPVKEALSSARSRVAAVAQVHRRLYTSEHISTVALDQYLETLLEDLQLSSRTGQVGVAISFVADPIQIDPDRAVAVGIIATELVINASKYAYPGGSGPVRVVLRQAGERVEFAVEDDGVGLVADDGIPASGLGNRIVRAMATKLGTSPVVEPREKGLRTCLTFPLAARPPAPTA